MGVHGLETFLKTRVPDGFKNINLIMEIAKFKRLNFNKRPILIFDVMAIVGYLCENKVEILCGGCFNFYNFHLSKIFSQLSDHCELIFFMDGFIQMNSKFSTWQKRQNEKYKHNIAIIDNIYRGMSLSEIAMDNRVYINTMLNVIEYVAIKFGTLKYAVNLECDQEIAQFAVQQSRVLAVFSDDSDFLIFEGRWRYFSMKSFIAASFSTIEYNRLALRTHCNLVDFQMSIFATCLGNDILCHKSIKMFQDKFKDKITDIAEFIRNNVQNMKTRTETVEFLVMKIFGADNDFYKTLINKSIQSYNIHHRKDAHEDFLSSYLLSSHMLFTRNVLANAPFNFSLIFYDLRQYRKSYYDISIKLFQRQAGVVFSQSGYNPFLLSVYSKPMHSEPYKMFYVEPISPPFDVLSMAEIHSNDTLHDNHRYRLLSWTICDEKLSSFNLRQIPKNYMIDILTVVFLVQNEIVTRKEADLILFSIKRSEQGAAISNPPSKLDPRAFHVAFLYTRMFANVARSIEICGLKKKYWKPLNFNGIDFHNLYNNFKNKDFDLQTYLGNLELNTNE